MQNLTYPYGPRLAVQLAGAAVFAVFAAGLTTLALTEPLGFYIEIAGLPRLASKILLLSLAAISLGAAVFAAFRAARPRPLLVLSDEALLIPGRPALKIPYGAIQAVDVSRAYIRLNGGEGRETAILASLLPDRLAFETVAGMIRSRMTWTA